MPLYRLKGKIEVANVDPEATSVLRTVWLKVSNIPGTAKDVESVKEIVNLVVEPIAVDEISLIKPGPVRVQGRCRNPTLIKGSIEVFFNGSRIPIGFEVEDDKGSSKVRKGGPPGPSFGKPWGVQIRIMISIIRVKGREAMTSLNDMGILIETWKPIKMTRWKMAWKGKP
jgi:hypothetical protein